MPEDFAPGLLASLVSAHVDADARALRLTRCGTGKHNTTYFVEGADKPLILRVSPRDDPAYVLFYEYLMMRQEPSLHARILSSTDVPVPPIVAHDFRRERIDRDYMIMERIPGVPISDHRGLSPDALDGVFRDVGRCLRQVHALTSPRYGYLGEHGAMEPQKDWATAFHIMWNKLLDDIERCGGYGRDEADRMRRLLDRRMEAFARPVQASLLHMDVWAQNILADHDGRFTCLLDWDRALWGDPEIEFAVCDYCGISEPSFWEGYGKGRDVSPEAEVRRVLYLLYELQKYIFIRRVRGNDPGGADRYRRQSLRIAEGLG